MLQLSVNLPELRDMAKKISQMGTTQLMELMKLDIKSQAVDFINGLMDCEFELFLGREKYKRISGVQISDRHLRNGHYQRTFAVKGLGVIYHFLLTHFSYTLLTKAIVHKKRGEFNPPQPYQYFFL